MAVALGASVVVDHFTLARADGELDSAFSLEPAELANLVSEEERSWHALGSFRYGPAEAQQINLMIRRSIYEAMNIAEGEFFHDYKYAHCEARRSSATPVIQTYSK